MQILSRLNLSISLQLELALLLVLTGRQSAPKALHGLTYKEHVAQGTVLDSYGWRRLQVTMVL
eukprot:3980423-Amphidinium_carterae.1